MYGSRERLPNGNLGKYVWKTFNEVYEIATSLAKTIEEEKFCTTMMEGGRIVKTLGILCPTREEWMYTWIAVWYASASIVPLYDTLGIQSMEWIIKQSELKTIVTTTSAIPKLLKLKREGKVEVLKNLVTIEEPSKEDIEECKKLGITLYRYNECIERGKRSKDKLNPQVTPDTLATICYTSGTTGNPKGVMLTHRNYISMAVGIDAQDVLNLSHGQACISWLPLAHVLEQFTATVCLVTGVKIGFYSGDIAKLTDDLKELKPEYFGGVPRVFNKIYEKTNQQVSKLTGFKKWLYNRGVSTKLNNLHSSGYNMHKLYDNILFSRIRKEIGGNVLLIFLGGAPISPVVLEMSRIWLSCYILQGYGQTETTGPIIVQQYDDLYPGSVGTTLFHAECKLIDIPEMKYLSTDMTDGRRTPQGEIMLRGGGVSPGYWREPELTKETFTEDGWVHTGDVGKLMPWGTLTIIDRKKNLFKLAQGEYIAPDALENIYQRSKYVAQIFVTGDSYSNFLVAIVIPNKGPALEWANENKQPENLEEICKNEEFKLKVLKDLEALGKEADRNGLEIIRNIYLTTTLFSTENNTMTPTQKIKRFEAGKMYEKVVKELYTKAPINLRDIKTD